MGGGWRDISAGGRRSWSLKRRWIAAELISISSTFTSATCDLHQWDAAPSSNLHPHCPRNQTLQKVKQLDWNRLVEQRDKRRQRRRGRKQGGGSVEEEAEVAEEEWRKEEQRTGRGRSGINKALRQQSSSLDGGDLGWEVSRINKAPPLPPACLS